MKTCKIYIDDQNLECCEHTHKPLIDAEPKELKGLIYYSEGSKCPHCKNAIVVIPF